MAKLSRDEQLVRAAHGRAIVTAFLANISPDGANMPDILEGAGEELREAGYNDIKPISNLLYHMVNNKLITMVKEDGTNVYYSTNAKKAGGAKQQKSETTVKKSAKGEFFQVDLIKSTGRIRITTKGVTIELGVIG